LGLMMESALRIGRKERIPRLDRVIRRSGARSVSRLDLLSDEELVERAKRGDEEAFEHLLVRYWGLIESKLKKFFLAGADAEDLLQEALIGFFKAVRDFNEEKAQSFKFFADLCITRQVTSAVRMATRQKHQPLNNSLPIAQPSDEEEGEERSLESVVAKEFMVDPDEQIFLRQLCEELKERVETELSDLERRVLFAHLEGKRYQEIAAELNCGVKCVDNALQRARKKLDKWVKAYLS